MDSITATLARFAAGLGYEDIPERVRERVKDLALDALACALAGYRGEDTDKVMRFASCLGDSHETSVIGGDRLSLAGATVFNGFLITAVSMCDVYRPTATHFQPVIVSPALAIAERDGATGRDLLVALTAGFETAARIAAGVDYAAFRKRGWHGPGTIGPFGAAAAVAHLCDVDTDTMAAAFGLAGSQAAGTFAAWGTPSVKFHQFRGALSGLMAALLAEQRFAAENQCEIRIRCGGLAQLGERLAGSQKVRGSSPLSSTTESLASKLVTARLFVPRCCCFGAVLGRC